MDTELGENETKLSITICSLVSSSVGYWGEKKKETKPNSHPQNETWAS